ncbi:MAG: hypothetical protein CBC13_09135 [Planctomycetia bacterium TMED53]|nr:MAG: hypothetical protein CBC13_09135 [Planctomycetia bacterium TMED53]
MNQKTNLVLQISDSNGTRQLELTGSGPWLVGRGDGPAVSLGEERCSRKHAEIFLKEGSLFIRDLGSTNGTLFDGKRLKSENRIKSDSLIAIGDSRIRLKNPARTKPIAEKKRGDREDRSSRNKQSTSTRVRSSGRRKESSTGAILILVGAIVAIGWLVSSNMPQNQEPELDSDPGRTALNSDQPAITEPTNSGFSIPTPKPLETATQKIPAETDPVSEVEVIERRGSSFDADSRFEVDLDSLDSPEDSAERDSSADTMLPIEETGSNATLSFRILDEAWPPAERIIAYEFHQKDHHGGPDFIDRMGTPIERRGSSNRKAYRVIALEVNNGESVERLIQLVTPLRKDLQMRFKVPAGRSLRRYLAIEDPGQSPVFVQMLDNEGEILQSEERILAPGHRTENLREALAVAQEREREEWIREQFQLRPIEVGVVDEAGNPIKDARVLLLNKESLAVVEGRTNEAGRWQSLVVPGAWTVVAHGEIEDEIDPDATTAVFRLPRVFLLQDVLPADQSEITLAPKKDAEIQVVDENQKPVAVEKIWITPESIAQAYTTERVAREVGARGRLESQKEAPGGRFRLLLSGMAVEICILGRTTDGEPALLRQRTAGDRSLINVIFDRSVMGRLEYRDAAAYGGATDGSVDVISTDGFRERFSMNTREAKRAWVFPGTYRLTVSSQLPEGGTCRFLPYRTTVGSGERHDLQPSSPWTSILHYERKDDALQMRLSISDAKGRVLDGVPSGTGSLAAVDSRGNVLIERELGPMSWQEPGTLVRVDLDKLNIQVDIPFGNSPIQGLATAETPVTVNAAGSSASGPSVFRRRMTDMMPEVSKSLIGCRDHLGCADGVQRLHMDFDIFLPPGVGGLGGGGVIVLDAAQLHQYTGSGDILPFAFTHELGHNIGFGHDPYMLLADSGVDEGLYGELGYRLLNAQAFQNTIDWLLNRTSDGPQRWQPNASVFAAIRFLHGLGVHRKMFTERRASEVTLLLHGLSSIERIAALYSLALGENIAWIFRANGWPVFDERVDVGGSSVKFVKKHPKKLNYNRLDGTIINGWWVRGPVEGKDADNSPWKRVVWPSPFTDLAAGHDPATRARRWILFRRIAVNRDMEARLAIAADVKLQVSVNSSPIGFVDASAQMTQPMHDELMLNQKKPFPVNLLKGENIIEISATQVVGTRGFRVELMTPDGIPVPMGVLDEGPPGEELLDEIVRVESHQPLLNGDFESEGFLDGWIRGEVDPGGSIRFEPETESIGTGSCAMRAEIREPGAGGIIQRIVVTPGKRYEVSGILKSEGFKGEALIGFFTGRIGSWSGRSKPLRGDSDWRKIKFEWSPGQSRTTYIACYVQGLEGTVWFDEIEFKELP